MATSPSRPTEVSELHPIDLKSASDGTIYCLIITRNTRSGEPRLEVRTTQNGSSKAVFHTLFPFQAIATHFGRVQTPFVCHNDDGQPLPFSVTSKHWKQATAVITPADGWGSQPCQHH